MNTAISVNKLVKKYGNFTAVKGISFEVPAGSVFAFLGTNGAGKTTTIGCLTTINAISGGEALINGRKLGQDDAAIRRDIGVVFQASLLDPLLTIRENLQSRAQFYGLGKKTNDRIAELSKLIGLDAILEKRYGTLSGGQKRRADIARALIHNPSILFLDEPTAGLDPQSREKVWQTIYGLQASQGLTVFLTTHYMEETERANLVYVVDAGEIIASGSPTDLRAQYSKDELRLTAKKPAELTKALTAQKLHYTLADNTFTVAVDSSMIALAVLKKYESHISDFEFRHGTMDDVFLKLTRNSDTTEEGTS